MTDVSVTMLRALHHALELEKGLSGEPWVAGRYPRTAEACERRGLAQRYQITPGGQTFYRITPAGRALAAELTQARARRGTSNRNVRGSSYNRASRRAFLLTKFGDGVKAPCYRCGAELDDSTITVDRIKPGVEGGRYIRSNIRPACGDCNSSTGGALGNRKKAG